MWMFFSGSLDCVSSWLFWDGKQHWDIQAQRSGCASGMTPEVPSEGSSTWIQELLKKTTFLSPSQPGKSWEADPSLGKGHYSLLAPGKCSTKREQNGIPGNKNVLGIGGSIPELCLRDSRT